MFNNRVGIALVLVFLAVAVTVHATSYAPEVTTTNGPVRGALVYLSSGAVVRRYLAIPFAKAQRFKAPQPADPWSARKDVIYPGKACPQATSSYLPIALMSEDCLHLDVNVPNTATSDAVLPVMVWIYGGAFMSGYNAIYDGSYIATLGNVIVVAINYRLNAFGFIATGKDGLTGNYGLLDQVEALKWVNKNIARFGGDPNKVTIFGESAGGASVALLMLSPLTKGLFKNVIIQSGAANVMWAAGPYMATEKQSRAYGEALGCKSAEKLRECLESKTMQQMVAKDVVALFPRLPVIDGNFLEDAPLNLLKTGKFDTRNVMIGVTNDEGTVLTNAVPGMSSGLNVSQGLTHSQFVIAVNTLYKDYTPIARDSIMYRYTDWSAVEDKARNRRMYVDLMSDAFFIAAEVASANFFAKAGAATYFYQLERRMEIQVPGLPTVPSWVGAYHGADIFFLFGAVLTNPNNTYTTDGNMSRQIIDLWTNFAKTGDPNAPMNVSVTWPLYNNVSQQYLSLKPEFEVNAKLRPAYMAFWNTLMPKLNQAKPPRPSRPPCTAGATTQRRQSGYRQVISALVICLAIVYNRVL